MARAAWAWVGSSPVVMFGASGCLKPDNTLDRLVKGGSRTMRHTAKHPFRHLLVSVGLDLLTYSFSLALCSFLRAYYTSVASSASDLTDSGIFAVSSCPRCRNTLSLGGGTVLILELPGDLLSGFYHAFAKRLCIRQATD